MDCCSLLCLISRNALSNFVKRDDKEKHLFTRDHGPRLIEGLLIEFALAVFSSDVNVVRRRLKNRCDRQSGNN